VIRQKVGEVFAKCTVCILLDNGEVVSGLRVSRKSELPEEPELGNASVGRIG